MSIDRDKSYLAHIVESIDLLDTHFSLLPEKTAWHEHPTVRDAVLRTLQVMAESCKKLSDELKVTMPEVDWRRASGFRDVLVHDYLGKIDYSVIAETMTTKLPPLKAAVKRILKEKYDIEI